MSQLDVKSLVKRFGGTAELVRRLNAKGWEATEHMIWKWYGRGSVPGEWQLRLAQLAEAEGRPLNIMDYLQE